MIEFEVTASADVPFVPRAKDEWLVNPGVEYIWNEFLTLRLGVGHANAIVGDKGVSPLLFDAEDTRVGVGFSLKLDRWSLDFMAGHAFRGSRDIGAVEALIFPGRYSTGGQIVMVGVTWRHWREGQAELACAGRAAASCSTIAGCSSGAAKIETANSSIPVAA